MFIGHWAPALAAAAIAPRAPKLGLLFLAGQLVDWGFALLAIAGVEKLRLVPGITVMNPMDLYHMPYTHSLVGTLLFAAIFGATVFLMSRDRGTAFVAGAVVVSHWLLDVLVHRPDMTLLGTPPKLGLGLWNYPFIEMPLELLITFGALYWYGKATRGPVGPIYVLGGVLLLVQLVNWFGPQPDIVSSGIFVAALVTYGVITAIAFWVGRTRVHRRAQG